MSVRYHCSHLETPHAPYPPSYPSSSSSFSPLPNLYFCEECDSVRCDQCVATEIASYYCPNCLFDVPSANVRGDKNRCARSCFTCPCCAASLQVIAVREEGPFLLVCPGCKWSSKEVGWEFEKGTGIALQLQKMNQQPERIQSEFELIKDHLDPYITSSTPSQPPLRSVVSSRAPSRHISHLTQMAAKALGKDVPGLSKIRPRQLGGEKAAYEAWDELGEYTSKAHLDWKTLGLERGMANVDDMRDMKDLEVVELEKRWTSSFEKDTSIKSATPKRIALQTKLTKRCPDGRCRHLLIQPDTKSTRFKIKMVASNYLPEVEIGRRRRRVGSTLVNEDIPMSQEEVEKRRRERRRTRGRAEEEDEEMNRPFQAGQVYTFQLAFTNPLYDPIQIRLTQPQHRNAPETNHHIHLPTQHFTVAALKDAWAYDEEEEEDDILPALESSEGVSEEGSSSRGGGTLGRRSRKSLLLTTPAGSVRDKKRGESGVEKKGNLSKVGLEIEILPNATGKVEFDLEVRYTYRAEEEKEGDKASGEKAKKEEYKNFTYWIRVMAGVVE